MRRRELLVLISGAAMVGSVTGHAEHVFRIGLLAPERHRTVLLQAFRDAGYDPGSKLIIEYRPTGSPEALSRFAAELVALNVDLIIAGGSQAVGAAQRATRQLPIVMSGASDPVGTGLVASLAHPGSNTRRQHVESRAKREAPGAA